MRLPLTISMTAAAAAAAFALAGVPYASAQTAKTLAFGPPAGQDITPMSAFTSGVCAGGTNLQMKVLGKGFAAEGVPITGNTGQTIYPRTANGGFEVPFPNTMRVIADDQHPPVVLDGRYTFVVTCRDRLSPTVYGSFTGSLTFTSPTRYTSAVSGTPRASTAASNAAGSAPAASVVPRTAPPRSLPPHSSVADGSASPTVSNAATEPLLRRGGSALPPALMGPAGVLVLAGAVTFRRRKSGRKQAFIRP